MEKQKQITKELRDQIQSRMEDSDYLLVALGEEMQIDMEQALEYSSLLQEKKDLVAVLSDIERTWLKRALFFHELEQGNNPVILEQLKYYQDLYELVKDRNYFLVSLCTDGLLDYTAFDLDRCVSPCGSLMLGQCCNDCSKQVYNLRFFYERMYDLLRKYDDPSELSMKYVKAIPSCPSCKKDIVLNIVSNEHYCERAYLNQWMAYTKWIQNTMNRKLTMLELGVGFDTPTVVRWPFEKMAYFNQKAYLVRVNTKWYQLTEEIHDTAMGIPCEVKTFLEGMQKEGVKG